MQAPVDDVTDTATGACEGPDADADPRAAPAPPRSPNASALLVALTELRAQLAAWVQHEPGARLGDDPEELHQLRVAVRRVEATLGLFKHQLSPRLLHARKGAKSMLRALGAVRDCDVQLAELERYCAKLPQSERTAADPLRTRLEEERTRARSKMIRTLDTEATRHWLETLSVGSADFTAANEPGAARALMVMPARVRGRFRKLKKAVARIDARSTLEDYHTVRRRAKQLRYALECGRVLFGKPAEEMLKALRRLQDRLGTQQDAHMAKNRLAAVVADAGARLPAATLFLMGRLAEHHLKETARARRTLARSWNNVSGRRWKVLRAKMQELSARSAPPAVAPQTSPAPREPLPPPAEPDLAPIASARALRH